MRFAVLGSAASIVAFVAAQAPSIDDYTAADIANGDAWRNVTAIADQKQEVNIRSRQNTTCTYDNAEVRVEWRDLAPDTRAEFTAAMTCLMGLPPQVMTAAEAPSYPGIRTRYDEFVATHINYTYNIHGTADFFAWHRAIVFFLHRDLIDLCDYAGPMPYWDWSVDSDAPQDSPLLSGDAYSMGGNGAYIANRSDTWLALQNVVYPPGTGGGCIPADGPFGNMVVHLGPLDLPGADDVNSTFEYNPHCLTRDVNPWFSQRYNTYDNLTRLVLQNIYLENFQDLAQGYDTDNRFGVHGGGHWQVGGYMADFHSSPNDPLFYLHHAQIDRVWIVWQNLDIANRQFIIRGTSTIDDSPPTPAMTLDDLIPFGFVAPAQTLRDLMDPFAGLFCYRYA